MLEEYKDVLTVDELREILRVGRSSAYSLIKNNRIKHIRIGSRIMIPKQYVIDFLKITD